MKKGEPVSIIRFIKTAMMMISLDAVKRKSTNAHYSRPNKYISRKELQHVDSDEDDSHKDKETPLANPEPASGPPSATTSSNGDSQPPPAASSKAKLKPRPKPRKPTKGTSPPKDMASPSDNISSRSHSQAMGSGEVGPLNTISNHPVNSLSKSRKSKLESKASKKPKGRQIQVIGKVKRATPIAVPQNNMEPHHEEEAEEDAGDKGAVELVQLADNGSSDEDATSTGSEEDESSDEE